MGRRSRRCWPGKVPSVKSKKHYDPPHGQGGQLHPQRMTSVSQLSFHLLPFLLLRLGRDPLWAPWHTSSPSPAGLWAREAARGSAGGAVGPSAHTQGGPACRALEPGLALDRPHGASPQGLRVSAELVSRPRCSLALGCLSHLVFVFLTLRQHVHQMPQTTQALGWCKEAFIHCVSVTSFLEGRNEPPTGDHHLLAPDCTRGVSMCPRGRVHRALQLWCAVKRRTRRPGLGPGILLD